MTEVNGWLSIPDAFAAMVFAQGGFDSVTLDMQHGLFDEAAVVRVLLALPGPVPRRLARTASADAGVIGKVLDFGADGVIVPLVNSAAEAALVARACRYPPRGDRSFGPVLAALRAGGDVHGDEAGWTPEVLVMIETEAGLADVEAIAAVDGVTGLYVGPNDLALSLGLGAGSDRREPEMVAAFKRIVAAAHAAGKRAGLFCDSVGYAIEARELGFDMLTIAGDAAALGAAGAEAVERFRGDLRAWKGSDGLRSNLSYACLACGAVSISRVAGI